jgi:hypothetical protein
MSLQIIAETNGCSAQRSLGTGSRSVVGLHASDNAQRGELDRA